tara:strand:- start:44 stop:817 length:774 start_codon:yes stop_codon:yes gene_type:complete
MAFKMNGSPAKTGGISGTAGHSSALKMRASENAASALKQLSASELDKYGGGKTSDVANSKAYKDDMKKRDANRKVADKKMPNADWAKGQKKAKSEGGNLDALVKSRGGLKKGTPEYNKVQNKINSALGNKKRYDEGPATTVSTSKNQTKVDNKLAKQDKKFAKQDEKRVVKDNERGENRKVQDAKRTRTRAKTIFGKNSAEHTYEKSKVAKAKGEDLSGEGGGKKAKLFGNLRRKLNKNRQARLTKKAEKLANEKDN